jgi:hypothetical protein
MSKIKIKYEDLETPEQGETFRDLFGESKFNEVKKKMADKVHGGKRYAELQQIVKNGTDDDYDKIRDTLMDEMDNLLPVKESYAEIEVGSSTRQSLMHSKREAAKDYLGEQRYGKATGYGDHAGYINNKSLYNSHPLAESHGDRKQRLAELKREKEQQEQQERNDKIERLTGGDDE